MEKCSCCCQCRQMPPSSPFTLPTVSTRPEPSLQKHSRSHFVQVIDVGVRYPTEWFKTLTMLLYAVLSMLFSSLVIVLVNNWVPAQELVSPLPDLFPRSFGNSNWAFKLSEFCAFLLLILWFIQWFILRYKSIVGRRFLFIMGTLYLYRTLTTYVTVLPVPSQYIICENKVYGNWEVILKQTLKLMSSGGLFLRRSPTFCGDYMYSGQAATLILTYLFIKTYSPDIFWLYHLFCWLLAVTGVISIMFTHTHYTLDVVAAYFVTTRIFWWYHTLANNDCLKTSSPRNGLSQVWWFRVFLFCEENVRAPVPHSYSWPVSCSLLQDCTLLKKKKRTINKWLNVGNGQTCEK